MPKLPVLYPKELVKILKRLGFEEHRQRGSHLIMIDRAKNKHITIPIHNRALKRGTLNGILRQAEISVEDIR